MVKNKIKFFSTTRKKAVSRIKSLQQEGFDTKAFKKVDLRTVKEVKTKDPKFSPTKNLGNKPFTFKLKKKGKK